MQDVSTRGTAAHSWRRTLVSIAFFGLLASLAVGLQIFARGEIWLDRTYWLVGLAAFGGLFGAAITRLAWHWIDWRITRAYPRLCTALLFAAAFVGAMMVAYVVQYILIGGQLEQREGRPWWAWFFIASEVSALFLISCPAYLLPLPLPALMVAAAWLLPTIEEKNRVKARKQVEP